MLPPANRLRKSSDFKKVVINGRRFFSTFFVAYKLNKKRGEIVRVGVVVSNKVSKRAVVRNRIRRWVRSDIRPVLQDFSPADYMIIVKPLAANREHAELKQDLLKLISKINDKQSK